MKIKLFTLLLLFIPTICLAEKYYVYIDKIGKVEKGNEGGQTAYGDVVGIYSYTPQYKPTRAELSRYKIIVADLTPQEIFNLTEAEFEGNYAESAILKARKRKVDIDKMTSIKQEQEIEKTLLINNTITKPLSISP